MGGACWGFVVLRLADRLGLSVLDLRDSHVNVRRRGEAGRGDDGERRGARGDTRNQSAVDRRAAHALGAGVAHRLSVCGLRRCGLGRRGWGGVAVRESERRRPS